MLRVLSRSSIGDWLTDRKLPCGVTRMVLLLPPMTRDPPPSDIVHGCSCCVDPNPVTSPRTCRYGELGTDATPSHVITGSIRLSFPRGCCCCWWWWCSVSPVGVPDARKPTSAAWLSDELRRLPTSSSMDASRRSSWAAADALQKVTDEPRWWALP